VYCIPTEGVKRIVVRTTNWVGDAVMSVPALRTIRAVFPSAHITLIVRPWVREVYSSVDFCDDILEFDKTGDERGVTGLLRFARLLRSRRFDVAILLQNAFEAALMTRLAGIPHRVGYDRDGRGFLLTHPCPVDPEVRNHHQCYYYLGILAAAGWIPAAPWDRPGYQRIATIGVRQTDLQSARVMLESCGVSATQPLIGVNPGAAYGGAKRWLADRFAVVADRLAAECGARALIFGSAADAPVAAQVAGAMRTRPVLLAGKTTLGQMMGLLSSCRLFLTNDSGPMHLAAALDVPQVAVFGSTSARATGPLSGRALVIRKPVDCSPCFLRECPIDFRCMIGVTVDEVYDAAMGLWRQLGV
jgi:lipopolysaccharide heptosyltransferase II